jgi:hypothetical protein
MRLARLSMWPPPHRRQLQPIVAECQGTADLFWRMIFSENRYPPRIKCGAGFFGIMRYSSSTVLKSAGSTISSTWQSSE